MAYNLPLRKPCSWQQCCGLELPARPPGNTGQCQEYADRMPGLLAGYRPSHGMRLRWAFRLSVNVSTCVKLRADSELFNTRHILLLRYGTLLI